MVQETTEDMIIAEQERRNFVRSAMLARSLRYPEGKIRELQARALWQMAAEWRNGAGTKSLARQFGISRKNLEELLRKMIEATSGHSDEKSLEPVFDYRTGKYLTFEEWLTELMKNWNRIPDS